MKRSALIFAALAFGLGLAACSTSTPKPQACPGIRYLRRPPHVLPRQAPIQMAKVTMPEEAVAGDVAPAGSPVVASGWCAIKAKGATGSGCDVGVGVALATRGRLSLVAVVGSKTVGTGLGWLAYRPTPEFPHAVAVAIGIVAPYDAAGIARKIRPALGATLTLGKGGSK